MPKKIAIFYAGAANWGGVETYIKQMFETIDPKKLELTLVSMGKWQLTEVLASSGYNVVELNTKWYQLFSINMIAKQLLDHRFELVTSQGLVANFFSRLAAKKAKIPHLITIHSDYKFDYKGVKRLLFWATFVSLRRLTQEYVVVSEFLERETIKLGVKPSHITVIYNGVKEIPLLTKSVDLPLVFGSLGRLHYKKGYHGLIEAASLLREDEFKVYIWGEGDERDELEALIKRYHLEEKVFLKGFTTDVAKALSEVDIYIQPSLEEGFGITVAEAMYAGKPIIITPAGSLPELIKDGETGLISKGMSPASIAAVMDLAINSHENLAVYGINAREDAIRRFSIKSWIKQIEDVYSKAATKF